MFILGVAGLGLSLAVPAAASDRKSGSHAFEYGKDVTAWFWNEQMDQPVAPPAPLPPPVPPVEPRVRFPNPQRPDTLPVAVYEGQHDKMSAIKFNLSERQVTFGSTINRLVLSIEESQDHNEWPSVSPETAKIQACPVADFLAPGESEQFADRPKYDDTTCVEGKREVPPAPAVPFWKLDLTTMAEPWGKDPFSNNGVMLLGTLQGGPEESWQVNLKIPSRDNADTPANEYELTKNRAKIDLEFTPGEPLGMQGGGGKGGANATSKGTGGSVPLSGGTTVTSGGGFVPSTDLTGSDAATTAPGAATAPAPAPTQVQAVAQAIPEPRMPSYVWLAIPLGLLVLSAVRSVVLEPVGGPRPDGVIAAIRKRNAERRGGPLPRPGDPLTLVASVLQRGTVTAGRCAARVGRGVSRLARGVVRR